MSDGKRTTVNGGVGFTGLLTIVFIVLKLLKERVMTREEAITVMQFYKDELEHRIAIAKIDYGPGAIDLYSIQLDAFDVAIEELSAEDEGANLINRHDAVTVIREECWKCNNMINDDLFMRIMSLPTSRQTDCTEFIMWLVEVVLDDEDWELNAVSYGEVIARKLKKLGLLEVKDGYYIRPSADAEPTVIRQKTFMSKEDFDKWAEDIKRQGENIICVPCDDEVVSADAVSREEYEETDGVIKIKKQSAKDFGEIKHIVVCSPNYTRYFYNDSMPTQYI